MRTRAAELAQQLDQTLDLNTQVRGFVLDFTDVSLLGLTFADELISRALIHVRRSAPAGMLMVVVDGNEDVKAAIELALRRQNALSLWAPSIESLKHGAVQLIGGDDALREAFRALVSSEQGVRATQASALMQTSRTNANNRLSKLFGFNLLSRTVVPGAGQPFAYRAIIRPVRPGEGPAVGLAAAP